MKHFPISLWEIVRVEEPEGGSATADGQDPPAPQPDPTEPPAPPSAPPQMVHVDVMQRRVAALTRQKADLEREVELLRLGQQLDPATPPATPVPPAAPQRPTQNLSMEARALAEQMLRDQKANAVAAEGVALAPDFMLRISTMNQMLGTLPNEFLDAVMAAGEDDKGAAELLYDLSKDLQRAGTLIGLPPARMAVELAKLKSGKKAPAPAAKVPPAAPAPIPPRAGTGGRSAPIAGDLADPNLDTDAWMRQRDEAARTSRRY